MNSKKNQQNQSTHYQKLKLFQKNKLKMNASLKSDRKRKIAITKQLRKQEENGLKTMINFMRKRRCSGDALNTTNSVLKHKIPTTDT